VCPLGYAAETCLNICHPFGVGLGGLQSLESFDLFRQAQHIAFGVFIQFNMDIESESLSKPRRGVRMLGLK